MRLIPLFVAVAAALVLFLSAPMETARIFKSTKDYIQRCNTDNPSDACKAGFRRAAVKVAAENEGKYCDPSGIMADRQKNKASWEQEIPRIAAWLSNHPQPADQGYMDSLGVAMVAVYPCK